MNNAIQKAAQSQHFQTRKEPNINDILCSLIDGNKMRKRFDELLGKRTPQFLSTLTSLINADPSLQEALRDSPMSVIQSALNAAILDLPIEPSLGFAYIVAFKNSKKLPDGTWKKVMEATLVTGYKGELQLCLRTGAYARIPDAVDVRQGELVHYDRLTGDIELKWVEDDDARERLPIVGYAGYFRLKNGAEKTIYMTVKQIKAHEAKHRKGEKMSKGWRDDFDAMARKTVIKKMGKYTLKSIEYRDNADAETVSLAQSLFDENAPEYPDYSAMPAGDDLVEVDDDAIVDPNTGEVISA